MDYSFSARQHLGQWQCRIVDGATVRGNPAVVVVLCHGFGAPGDDLVPLAQWLLDGAAGELDRVRFVFPEAPLEVDPEIMPDARAWWPIDFAELERAVLYGEVRDLRARTPQLLPARRREFIALIEALGADDATHRPRLVIGGFSQGAMLATDTALHWHGAIDGLIIWSGTIINESEWRQCLANRQPIPVVQSHGTADPLLAFLLAEELRDALAGAGWPVEFVSFPGQHTIAEGAVAAAARLIAAASRSAPD
jgi:phospholipase/carboxylesterase